MHMDKCTEVHINNPKRGWDREALSISTLLVFPMKPFLEMNFHFSGLC